MATGTRTIRDKIEALRAKTVANGCTAEEAKAAQVMADKLEKYNPDWKFADGSGGFNFDGIFTPGPDFEEFMRRYGNLYGGRPRSPHFDFYEDPTGRPEPGRETQYHVGNGKVDIAGDTGQFTFPGASSIVIRTIQRPTGGLDVTITFHAAPVE